MEFSFNPKGVCSKKMTVVVEDGKIASLKVEGGCDGNLRGISKLVVGMTPEECISRLDGIRCKEKPSSCPGQLAEGLKEYLKKIEN